MIFGLEKFPQKKTGEDRRQQNSMPLGLWEAAQMEVIGGWMEILGSIPTKGWQLVEGDACCPHKGAVRQLSAAAVSGSALLTSWGARGCLGITRFSQKRN